MSRIALSNTGDWKLSNSDQDIRGHRVLDASGTEVGVVDAMIVDTATQHVETIVLEDGTEVPARDLTIGDGVVYLPGASADMDVEGEVRVYGDSGKVLRRERVEDADYDAHADAFRTHYDTSYGEGAFEDAEPAYRYGFESASSDDYRNRPYLDAEDDLRTGYGSQAAGRDFDADREAVRYGYTRAQHGVR